jgi:fatty-acyl-CoA synthase
MQDRPLNVGLILRHAERIHGRKTLATRTTEGITVATFAQVTERSRRLIAALRALGVEPGDRVGTFSWNHQQHVEAYLGIPAMGAVLHTLNIRLFASDLAYIVSHAGDRVVIVDKSLWPAWEKVRSQVSCIEKTIVIDDAPGPLPDGTLDYEKLLANHAPTNDLPEVEENAAAAVCYTSGTTGHPKGVVYSHRSNVLHSFMAMSTDTLGLSQKDVVLPIVPMFHANAWGMPYGCLFAGSHLVMPGRFMQPAILLDLLVERRVTFAAGVPSIWLALLEPMKKAKERLGALERIGCGGSAVPAALQRAYKDEVGIPICQAWGMTETSPLASLNHASRVRSATGPELDALLGSVGQPVPGVEARICDDAGHELPWDGQSVGELEVRGPWIAKAYFKDSSGDRFHDGWLRTGDVAAIDSVGAIRITDRTKDLIKSGGEWISSVELEGLLMGHPGVAEAAVVAVAHPRWCERPLACVVARSKGALSREGVLSWLEPRVAKWWLPDDVVFLDEIPKTSVGKFDKKVLRERFKEHVLPTAHA